ncbi:MAG: transposase [Candidatus Izemoplasmatales bacterium]
MYLIGIDISKYKHDCFIATETGEIIKDTFSFTNNQQGFTEFHNVLQSLDPSQTKRIGLEATGHYGRNLKMFCDKHV